MNNLSTSIEIVAQKPRKVASKGRPLVSRISVDVLINVKRKERDLKKLYQIGDRCYSVILELVDKWSSKKVGMTLTDMCVSVYGTDSGAVMTTVHNCKDLLIAKGFVEYVGRNKRGFKVFAPTVKLLNAINEVLSVVA